MQVISFMNMKGGVGKTTLAVNIAYGLAYFHRKKVLVVDSDPQFNATQSLLRDKQYLAHLNDPAKGTLKDIFIPRKPGAVNAMTLSGVTRRVTIGAAAGILSAGSLRIETFEGRRPRLRRTRDAYGC